MRQGFVLFWFVGGSLVLAGFLLECVRERDCASECEREIAICKGERMLEKVFL